MRLLELYAYYAEEKTEPIPYENFQDFGWSENQYLLYLNYIEGVRSAAILYHAFSGLPQYLISDMPRIANNLSLNRSDKIYKNIIESAVKNLNEYLQLFEDTPIDLIPISRIIIVACASFVTYQGSFKISPVTGEPNCALVYKSLDDFRLTLENDIYCVLKGNGKISIEEDHEASDITEIEDIDEVRRAAKMCEDALSVYVSYQSTPDLKNYETIQKWAHIESGRQEVEEKLEGYLDEINELMQYEYTNDKILYVHKGRNIVCQKDKHDIVCVNANLSSVTGENITINVNYCRDCNKFFISEEEYDFYRKQYPNLLAKFQYVNENYEKPNIKREEYSPLSLNGYNVRKNGPNEGKRQAILSAIMRNGIMEKYEIINHLEMLINTNGTRSGMQFANEKWYRDLDFVRRFDMDIQDEFQIGKIEKYRH